MQYGLMKHRILLALCLFLTTSISAQEFTLSTNLLDWANLGTANLQAGIDIDEQEDFIIADSIFNHLFIKGKQ